MGGWSAALSPPFLDFVGPATAEAVLDVGCGTGNLLTEVAKRWPRARLAGVEPAREMLAKAGRRPSLAGAELRQGVAEDLPFADGVFDATLSMLVLQEFPDRRAALGEMRRVTRPGGIVAGCQWDFARMPVIRTLIEAICAVDAEAGERINARSPAVFADEAELELWWRRVGFSEVAAGRITATRRFSKFDEVWLPLLRGATPSTMALASLPVAEQAAVRERMLARLGGGSEGPLEITAEALVAGGRA
jgi:ubiquinone/menaquinone biosynthesis C-methylase UbiE